MPRAQMKRAATAGGDERSSAKDGVREDGEALVAKARPITTPCYRPNWILIIV